MVKKNAKRRNKMKSKKKGKGGWKEELGKEMKEYLVKKVMGYTPWARVKKNYLP